MNRKAVSIGLAVVVVLVLAAGAFTAVRLMSAQGGGEDLPAGAIVYEDVMDDGSGSPVAVKTVILPSPDLPDRPAEAGGVLVRQEDNSYYVGTGSISVNVEIVNGETSTAVDHSGPEVEVVTGHDTQFYRDVTEVDFSASESKEQTFTQEIVPVDQPDAVSQGANFQAWGVKNGDRVAADIVVFSDPR